ncbi:hypothetical protein BDW74DRAFT_151124 [Aspergillus multicolor]|uniref:uncharacterized protein n=1 Tax=Aspergillus multicolor TaxID=41759 RepID=UPI003CCCCA82
MGKTWTGEAERKLLVGILAQIDRVDYQALAAHMGDGFPVTSLRQQICKLRREAGVSVGHGRPRAQPSGVTPRKPKQPASKESPISRAKRPNYFIDDDDEDDEDMHKDVKPIIKEEDDKKKPKIEPSVVELVD